MHFKENCCKFEGEKRSSNSSLLTHFISWFLIRTTQTRETRNQKPTQTNRKRPLISDHIKGPLVAAFRSPLMKALDRSVETLGLWIVTSSVTFIKSANQCSMHQTMSSSVFLLKIFRKFGVNSIYVNLTFGKFAFILFNVNFLRVVNVYR